VCVGVGYLQGGACGNLEEVFAGQGEAQLVQRAGVVEYLDEEFDWKAEEEGGAGRLLDEEL
jgi:hypothetical protein